MLSSVGPSCGEEGTVELGVRGDEAEGERPGSEADAWGEREEAGEKDQVVTRDLKRGVCSDAVACGSALEDHWIVRAERQVGERASGGN
jgi:hypothetical protein